eukprot:9174987-Alexandrium_andersonii.AAC.1
MQKGTNDIAGCKSADDLKAVKTKLAGTRKEATRRCTSLKQASTELQKSADAAKKREAKTPKKE